MLKDISRFLASPPALSAIDFWVGIESRGFLFAAALTQRFNNGLVVIRKKGKLPPPTVEVHYTLEYGADTVQMHPGSGKVVLVDDVLGTGGTLRAAHDLCQRAGYDVVGYFSLIDLTFLHGHQPLHIAGKKVHSVITYDEVNQK